VATLSYSSVLFAGLYDLLAAGDAPSAASWLGMSLIAGAGLMTVMARRAQAAKATLAHPDESQIHAASGRPH
jgi:drug/metabolite transporter (DMT)-like permease